MAGPNVSFIQRVHCSGGVHWNGTGCVYILFLFHSTQREYLESYFITPPGQSAASSEVVQKLMKMFAVSY